MGWNNLIIPLESANEKNDMDWSDVRNIRLNVSGATPCRVATANMQIVHSGVTEPTVVGYVEPTEPEPDRTVTLTEEGGIVSFSSNIDGLATDQLIMNVDPKFERAFLIRADRPHVIGLIKHSEEVGI